MKDWSFLYDTFTMYYEKGITARNNGKLDTAKRNLLLSAEILLRLAKESSGELKKARADRADRIINMANNIEQYTASQIAKDASGKQAKDGDETLTLWQSADVPNVTFDDVAGLDDVKDSIRMRVLSPMEHPEIYKAYNKNIGGGVLLYGPPGTGKTMIAKAIAHEANAKFFAVKCSDIVSKWFGEAEKNIRNLFATARGAGRAIIFFDEFEALATRRGENNTVMNRVVPELLSQIQGFEDSQSQLLLLAATNRVQDIDSAMLRPGRFNELIYIPLPDSSARKSIIKKSLSNIPTDKSVAIDEVVQLTEGFNGADVVEFCDRAKDNPIRRSIADKNGKIFPITREDIDYAKSKVHSSVQKKDIEELNNFRKQFQN